MKIAIANDNGYVSQHFGHCSEYMFFEIDNNIVTKKWSVPTPPHQPGVLPEFLANHGADCVIAGGMGARAQELLKSYGIEVVLGVQGSIDSVLEAYLNGSLASGENVCDH